MGEGELSPSTLPEGDFSQASGGTSRGLLAIALPWDAFHGALDLNGDGTKFAKTAKAKLAGWQKLVNNSKASANAPSSPNGDKKDDKKDKKDDKKGKTGDKQDKKDDKKDKKEDKKGNKKDDKKDKKDDKKDKKDDKKDKKD